MDRIIELFAKNRLLVNVIILVTLAVGIYSYLNIKKEAFPSTNFDVMIVQVIYPGASPVSGAGLQSRHKRSLPPGSRTCPNP